MRLSQFITRWGLSGLALLLFAVMTWKNPLFCAVLGFIVACSVGALAARDFFTGVAERRKRAREQRRGFEIGPPEGEGE